MHRFFERLSDRALWLLVSLVLFLSAAWPLAFVDLPPLQDLPNHLATAHVIQNPAEYPEYVFNGFFKTNSALFIWLRYAGAWMGLRAAAKAFVAIVLAANALVIPRLVLEVRGRRALGLAAFGAWPMIHHWFVSMGMLDYALGVAVALEMVVLLARQSRSPSAPRAVVIAALAALAWLTHVFALLVVGMLALVHLASSAPKDRASALRFVALPLAPIAPLVGLSMFQQLRHEVAAMGLAWVWGPPWELAYNAWAEFLWAFGDGQMGTLAAAALLALWLARGRSIDVPILSVRATIVMGAAYLLLPYHAANWYHVGSRFLPFLWVSALLRVPASVPRAALAVLGVSWAAYSATMGLDYMRMDRALRRFAAGEEAVPRGASLLPLVFQHKEGSVNTHNMLHAWGLYVADRGAHVPLVFAHSHSFPITWVTPQPATLDQRYLENFASTMRDQRHFCETLTHIAVVPADCPKLYDDTWNDFYSVVEPRFEALLFDRASDDALAHVPPSYRRAFEGEHLVVFVRAQGAPTPSAP